MGCCFSKEDDAGFEAKEKLLPKAHKLVAPNTLGSSCSRRDVVTRELPKPTGSYKSPDVPAQAPVEKRTATKPAYEAPKARIETKAPPQTEASPVAVAPVIAVAAALQPEPSPPRDVVETLQAPVSREKTGTVVEAQPDASHATQPQVQPEASVPHVQRTGSITVPQSPITTALGPVAKPPSPINKTPAPVAAPASPIKVASPASRKSSWTEVGVDDATPAKEDKAPSPIARKASTQDEKASVQDETAPSPVASINESKPAASTNPAPEVTLVHAQSSIPEQDATELSRSRESSHASNEGDDAKDDKPVEQAAPAATASKGKKKKNKKKKGKA
ncbi:hypothetical protein SPRG_11527 [Saprolegnia parasitica CBS 223.65]|uniref:Uncharacterized protein n=1 Tax=Saprolegnia parasitica (strain CBS 223.65) TaxID=695850 RepID=A0A067BY13_SAPPC|nr:hypothetical protein SPRG_11527 [Saprolegnia parasitica CBS 223.65]KDO23434.1 hypothetical protein SPRG_11527 [Saprolegnia parasitica CBS 223.65]|eukprot:XP_012205921.1 hypothetical protein SPRG_11527 [Saprolegnia parasitica CBS 223.65]